MPVRRSKTKILVDGGDPEQTLRVKSLVGTVDGQTTNPTLIAKNPEVQRLVSSGHKFSPKEELDEYKKIVQAISPLVGEGESGGVRPFLYPSGPRIDSRHLCSSGIPYCGNIRLPDNVDIRPNQMS
jgi:hypothetical protein